MPFRIPSSTVQNRSTGAHATVRAVLHMEHHERPREPESPELGAAQNAFLKALDSEAATLPAVVLAGPWKFGEESEGVIRSYIHARYKLMPSLIAAGQHATRTGFPLAARCECCDAPQLEEADERMDEPRAQPQLNKRVLLRVESRAGISLED